MRRPARTASLPSPRPPRRTLRYWLADHVLTLVNAALAALLAAPLTLFASGLFLAPAQSAGPTTTTTPPPHRATNAALDTSPAAVVAARLLSDLATSTGYAASDPSFATTDPLLAGCPSSALPVAQVARSLTLTSATLTVVADLDVYGAGLGGLATSASQAATAACPGDYVQTGAPAGLDGYVASTQTQSGSSILEVTLHRGDVVVSIYAFPTGWASATSATLALADAINADLAPLLATNCADATAPASAATRNPTEPGYRPYGVVTVVAPPASVARPDGALLYGPLPVIAPPPPGSVTTPPVEPTVPTVPLSRAVTIPTFDATGPGCGWAFTAMVPPPFTSSSGPATMLEQSALAALELAWRDWPRTVTTYLAAKAQYLANRSVYDATLAATTTTTLATPTTTTTLATPTPSTTVPATTTTSLAG